MGVLTKLKSLVTRAGEGQWRPGPYQLPVSGGMLDDGGSWNWWQRGYQISGYSPSALVEACIAAYAQTVAQCPGDHWLLNETTGGRSRVTTSSLSRVLKRPNEYQSISDFLLNLVDNLYSQGNAYALALRNSRYEIQELHLMNPWQCSARISPETGDVFYALGGNEVIDYQLNVFPLLVPARDVLHVRMNTSPHNMMLGEAPLVAAARDIAANDAIMQQQLSFYLNQARPSTVLQTDLQLTREQVNELRDRWNEQSRGLNAGGTPILGWGIKPMQLQATAESAQLAEILKLTRENIAMVYRVPLQMLGIGGTPTGPTEALMQGWIQSGLGFTLNHIEEAIGNLFDLWGYPDEYVEFNTDALLRSLMKDRVEAFARGVLGGIYAPNEARAEFGLPKAEAGDEPRLQAQVVPLTMATVPSAPSAPAAPVLPKPEPSPAALPAAKDFSDDDIARIWSAEFIDSSDDIDRRRLTSPP